jgi:predicted transcriptional regulator
MSRSFDFDLQSSLQPYLEKMINNLPNGPKLVMQALSKKDWNKEDLSLKSGVRRGELNYAVCWLEALGFAEFNSSGRQKLYSLTPLGHKAYEQFNELFQQITEEERD